VFKILLYRSLIIVIIAFILKKAQYHKVQHTPTSLKQSAVTIEIESYIRI